MGVRVQTWSAGQCQVVAIDGLADQRLLACLADGIAAVANGERPVVVDLDGLMSTDLGSLRVFEDRLRELAPGRVVLSCTRLSGRRNLRPCGTAGTPLAADRGPALAAAQKLPLAVAP